MNYTYIVRCADDTLYTGWTNNIQKRLDAHNHGRGAKYTRARFPVALVYLERFDEKQEAMRREYFLKQLSRPQKEALIAEHEAQTRKLMKEATANATAPASINKK